MMVPTIHLNGTSKQELLDQLCDAANALVEANRMVQRACPNSRDYYPQGNEVIRGALEAHWARMVKLEEVRQELLAITKAIEEPEAREPLDPPGWEGGFADNH